MGPPILKPSITQTHRRSATPADPTDLSARVGAGPESCLQDGAEEPPAGTQEPPAGTQVPGGESRTSRALPPLPPQLTTQTAPAAPGERPGPCGELPLLGAAGGRGGGRVAHTECKPLGRLRGCSSGRWALCPHVAERVSEVHGGQVTVADSWVWT